MSFKLIVLNTGYVETSSLGMVVFKYRYLHKDEVFSGTPQECVAHFATALFVKWWWDTNYFFRNNTTKETDWSKVVFNSFRHDLQELPCKTADSSGGEEVAYWWPWLSWPEIASVPLEQTIHIREKAEELLPLWVDTTALGEDFPPELSQLYTKWILREKTQEEFESYRQELFKKTVKTYEKE